MATTEKKLNSVITKLERERAHVSTLRANEDNLRAQCQQLKREARSTRAEAIELVHANTSLQRTKAMEQERERLEASYQHEVDLIKVLHETELADVESTKLSLAAQFDAEKTELEKRLHTQVQREKRKANESKARLQQAFDNDLQTHTACWEGERRELERKVCAATRREAKLQRLWRQSSAR